MPISINASNAPTYIRCIFGFPTLNRTRTQATLVHKNQHRTPTTRICICFIVPGQLSATMHLVLNSITPIFLGTHSGSAVRAIAIAASPPPSQHIRIRIRTCTFSLTPTTPSHSIPPPPGPFPFLYLPPKILSVTPQPPYIIATHHKSILCPGMTTSIPPRRYRVLAM
jgi:hypothetical protein